MLSRLRQLLSSPPPPPVAAPRPTPAAFIDADPDDPLRAFRAEHPEIVRVIDEVTVDVVQRLGEADLEPLAAHHVALRGYDWSGYLSASRYRIEMVAMLLLERGPIRGRVLDSGSYFGNFALAFSRLGCTVTACDTYGDYHGALDPWRALLEAEGVEVIDPGDFSGGIPVNDASSDIALSCGVIEHIPHSPRAYLLELHRALRPGGTVLIETPNLAYQHKRDLLAAGTSVHPPIESQFESVPPFAGHHREYTASELEWMLDRIGFDPVRTAFFDYSHLALTEIDEGTETALHERRRDPTRQELVIALGARRNA